MSQRHQIYVRLPKMGGQPERTIGIHHNWLMGAGAVKMLSNYLNFVKNAPPRNPAKEATALEVLKATYSMDVSSGHYFAVDDVTADSIIDPRKASNNNGITVIDLRGETPKYAFLAYRKLECDDKNFPNRVRHPNDPDFGQEVSYAFYSPIDVTQWVELHFGKAWMDNLRKNTTELENMKRYVNTIKEYVCMDVYDLASIFPNMVSATEGHGLYPKANTLRFILDDKPLAVKATSATTSIKVMKKKTDVARKRAY